MKTNRGILIAVEGFVGVFFQYRPGYRLCVHL